jgi:hypothetical protein
MPCPSRSPALLCRGLEKSLSERHGICELAFRGIAACIFQLDNRSTTVLMLTNSSFASTGSTLSAHWRARTRCVCFCLFLPDDGQSVADADTMQAVQPSRVLVWSCCQVALCSRECCKPVLKVTRAIQLLLWATARTLLALLSERASFPVCSMNSTSPP